ncbi:MAG: hypothetical protein WCW78_00625 [Candidatus Paceibacterota bacterium]|jgi:exonuclease VII small subunit
MATKENKSFKQQMEELSKILAWFDASEELDVEAALKKVKQAADLIQASKKRLAEVENEFKEIKKEIEE